MKKVLVLLTILAVMFFAGNVFAQPQGIVGLEISGGSLVGAQGYIGSTFTYSAHDSCFSSSVAFDKTGYIGVNLMSSANGTACLKTSGNTKGSVSGYGNFSSGISGYALGAKFYTNSSVHISGQAR